MSEADDAEYRRRIGEVLEGHGFGWVVAQAEVQIAEGKPASKQVSDREIFPVVEEPYFSIRKPRSRRASLITSEPYNESERLEILLHAIEAALSQRSTLENAALDAVPGINAIRFESESTAEVAESYYLGKPHEIDRSRRPITLEIEQEATAALARIRSADRASA